MDRRSGGYGGRKTGADGSGQRRCRRNRSRARSCRGSRTGVVTLKKRFGSALIFNEHLQVLILEDVDQPHLEPGPNLEPANSLDQINATCSRKKHIRQHLA
jgi:hypothetical protein